MQAKQIACYRDRGYLGMDFLPYQISLGATLRVFEGRLHFRVYLGPFKLYGGGL